MAFVYRLLFYYFRIVEDLTIAENELFDGTIPSELGTLSNLGESYRRSSFCAESCLVSSFF